MLMEILLEDGYGGKSSAEYCRRFASPDKGTIGRPRILDHPSLGCGHDPEAPFGIRLVHPATTGVSRISVNGDRGIRIGRGLPLDVAVARLIPEQNAQLLIIEAVAASTIWGMTACP